ncbi:ISH3 family transposase [Halorubrum ezzemoulense]|nr:ISH3 family transposase [Halorubrum ezzemoulense]MDB2272606.1 ISH3 family transposase [Halorubrum ezzemoulense]
MHEDQLLNFLVNRLDEEVPISLANNAEIAAEDIYEVLVGACADGTSVSTLCASSQNTPTANTILYHLRTKFEPERLERVANTLLRKDIDGLLPKQVEICADLHLRPYYGDEADTDGLYHSVAKRGTTAFHAYATLYARVTNKHYTLAVRRLEDGDTASSVLAEFLGILDGLDTEVKAVYLDRGFYDSKCLTLLQTHDYAYVIPIIRWGETIQQELSEGWSRVIQHDLTGKLDGHSWTVEFPVYIDCTYLNGKYDENGVARHGYAADAPFIDSPRDARYHYSKRFGIESSYRLFEQAISTTTTRDPTVRLLYVVVSLLLQNVWWYLHYEYVATPRRGGRRLWWWPYKEFVNMIRRAAWTALAVRQAVPANRPPGEPFHR